jgi:hypothetical protein
MLSSPNFNILTILLAGWGAILSTILAVREINKDKRKIKVFSDFFVNVDSELGEKSTIFIRAVNIGHRPIEIIKAGFLYEKGQDYYSMANRRESYPLPQRLADGESVTIKYNLTDFESIMLDDKNKEVRLEKVYVEDSEGRRYVKKLSREERKLFDRATFNFLNKEQEKYMNSLSQSKGR